MSYTTGDIVAEILTELGRARKKHPERFHSPHEAYAILLEEVDEVWAEIKRDDPENARKELIQVGAVLLRFLCEIDFRPAV